MSFIDRHARECAQVLASSWEVWHGDCEICATPSVSGFCDRCTECAIESVYSNEMEYGGTSEYVRDALGIPYGSGRCVRLLDAVVGRTMEYQAEIWRGVGQ